MSSLINTLGGLIIAWNMRCYYDSTLDYTGLIDEGAPVQSGRISPSYRCLLGDGLASIDFTSLASGVVSLKGYTKTGGTWSYGTISTGLAAGVLTLQSSTYYKTIELYDDGEWVTTFFLSDVSAGTNYNGIMSCDGHELSIASFATSNRVEQTDIPYDACYIDKYGYSLSRVLDVSTSDTVSTASSSLADQIRVIRYDHNSVQYEIRYQCDGTTGNLVTDGNGDVQGHDVANDHTNIYRNYVAGVKRESRLLQVFTTITSSNIRFQFDLLAGSLNGVSCKDYSILSQFQNLVSSTYSVSFSGNSHIADVSEFFWALNGDDYTGNGGHADGNNYPDTQLGITGATCSGMRQLLAQSGVSNMSIFVGLFESSGAKNSTQTNWGDVVVLEYNGTPFGTINTTGVHDINLSVNDFVAQHAAIGGSGRTGYFALYDNTLRQFADLRILNDTSVDTLWVKILKFIIQEDKVVPSLRTDNFVDAKYNDPIDYFSRYSYPSHIVDIDCGYATIGDFIECPTDDLDGVTVSETEGTAIISVDEANDRIQVDTSGTLLSFTLSDGRIYACQNNRFGSTASTLLYDVSGNGGSDLTINATSIATFWGGSVAKGKDWVQLYGCTAMRNTSTNDTIAVPCDVNKVELGKARPSGYTEEYHLVGGAFLYDGTTIDFAEGYTDPNAELNSFVVGTDTLTNPNFIQQVSYPGAAPAWLPDRYRKINIQFSSVSGDKLAQVQSFAA